MKTRYKVKVTPFMVAIILGFVLPALFLLMIVFSCPHSGEIAYFPLISAQCPSEFVGTIGFIFLAFSGIAAGTWLTSGLGSSLWGDSLNGWQAFFLIIAFSAVANVAVYWIVIRSFMLIGKTFDLILRKLL